MSVTAYLSHEAGLSAYFSNTKYTRRSHWPWELRRLRSSTARTLGSWVRIPLEACTHTHTHTHTHVYSSLCVVLSCVGMILSCSAMMRSEIHLFTSYCTHRQTSHILDRSKTCILSLNYARGMMYDPVSLCCPV
jgi:hypothetical protein